MFPKDYGTKIMSFSSYKDRDRYVNDILQKNKEILKEEEEWLQYLELPD